MTSHEIRDISFGEREPRRAIRAVVETPHGPLIVVATHLGLSIHERRHQAALLMELASGDAPAVVIGDLNDWYWPGSVRAVLTRVLGERTQLPHLSGEISVAAARPHLLPAARRRWCAALSTARRARSRTICR